MQKSRTNKRWPTVVDLFSGSGAATSALKAAHFRVVAAVDSDPEACATYRLNHRSVRLYENDIRSLAAARIKKECLGDNPLDLMVICAPCQPFSNQNQKREGDARARLLIDATRFVRALKPRVILVENVPGIAAVRNIGLIEEFMDGCGSAYRFGEPHLVDAADYSTPQRRRRCLMMATRGGPPPALPEPTTPDGSRLHVRDAIFALRRLSSGEADPHDRLHAARKHKPIALTRMSMIKKDGGTRFDLPENLTLDCHKGKKGFPDVYGRMAWDDVSPTLTTGCTDLTKGRYGHPEDDRAITPREAALLQTFPPDYKFAGPPKTVATQIGNAVPPALFRAIAPSIREALRPFM